MELAEAFRLSIPSFYYFRVMTKNEIIAQVNLSLQNLNVNKVILFGSYSKGTQSDDSDIDLLVVTNDNFVFESFAQKMEVKIKIANALNSLRKFADIDLIVHTKPMYDRFIQLNSGFKKEILSSGSVIYEANN
jgi:predicted nucleotidyltransferase